jgi:ribosome maturation factor RimP
MISAKNIENLILSTIEEKNLFIVKVEVRTGNKIIVLLDSDKNVSIADCVEVSRLIENSLDRDEEDFELEVSSFGLDMPLAMHRQYIKRIGQNLVILAKDGQKLKGKLIQVFDNEIEIETEQNIKLEGKKKKQKQIVLLRLPFNNIKSTMVQVTF